MTEGRVSHTKEGRVSQMTDCKSHRSNRISQDRSLVGRVFQKAASHSSWKGRNRADFRQTFDNINGARKTQLTGRARLPSLSTPPPVHPRPPAPLHTPLTLCPIPSILLNPSPSHPYHLHHHQPPHPPPHTPHNPSQTPPIRCFPGLPGKTWKAHDYLVKTREKHKNHGKKSFCFPMLPLQIRCFLSDVGPCLL